MLVMNLFCCSDNYLTGSFFGFFMKRVIALLVFAFIVIGCTPAPQVKNVTSEVLVEEPDIQSPIVETPVDELLVDEKAASCAAVLCPVNTICENGSCIDLPQKKETTVSEPANVVKKYLEEAKTKFSGYAYQLEDRMVVVFDGKARHYFFKVKDLKDRTPVTDIYVDLMDKKAVGYCNIEREGRMVDSFEYSRSRCKDYVNKEIPVGISEDLIPKGPVEYMEFYAGIEPVLVENNLQTISIGGNSKSIQPSVHFLIDGMRHVLRLDRKYHVPLKIDIEGEQPIDFRDVYFDMMVLEGKQQKIDSSWITYAPVADYITKESKP